MLHRFVGDGELAQVVASYFGLDFHLAEGLAVAHPDCTAHYLM
jgi:hypothetical protein